MDEEREYLVGELESGGLGGDPVEEIEGGGAGSGGGVVEGLED